MRTKNRVSWVLSVLLFAVLLSAMLFSTKGISVSAEDPIASENWVKADTVVNVGDSMLNDDDSWNFVDGTPTKQDNTVSVGTSSLVRISNQTAYTDVSYSFKMKLDASTPTAWLAYVGFRTTEYNAAPWETINSGMYWLEFTHNRMALSKHVGGRNEITNASYTPGDNFFTSFHEYCISVINDENGTDVKIVVYVDGVKAIDVTDTSGVTHAGGFRVFTHNTSGGGIEQIQFQKGTWTEEAPTPDAPTVNVGDSMLNDDDSWNFVDGTPTKQDNTVSVGTSSLVRISNQTAYTDVNYIFNMKLDASTPTAWLAYVGFRTTEYNAAPWETINSGMYWLEFTHNRMALSKHVGGRNEITNASYTPGDNFFTSFHEYCISVINDENGTDVKIVVYVDGVKAIDVTDTSGVTHAGGFRVFTHNTSGGGIEQIQFQKGTWTEEAPTPDAPMVNVTLDESLTVNYYFDLADTYANAQMKFTMNGVSMTVAGEATGASNRYVFRYTDVAPQCIGDTFTAELIAEDGETVLYTDTYSVEGYLTELASYSASELGMSEAKYAAMKTLIADLLVYGGAAQKYIGHNVSDLVSEGVTGATEYVELDSTDLNLTDSTVVGTSFTTASMFVDNVNNLIVKFTAASVENLTVSVSKNGGAEKELTVEKIAEGKYQVKTDAILASQVNDVFTFTIKVDGNVVQTLTYSVKAYVYTMQNKMDGAELSAMAMLARSLYNYGLSAIAFVNA